MKARRRMASVLVLVLFLLVSLIMLFPVYYLIIGSLQDGQEIFRAGMKFFLNPGDMKWSNYPNLFTYNNGIYTRWFSNSVFYAVAFTVCALAFSSLVGYGLGAYDFKGKNAIFVLVLAVMMIPLEILMLPLYKLIVKIKLINTVGGIIFPFMVAPVAIFFFRQFVSGISREFMESARIDGCTEFGIFYRIMVPLMKPAFGAMTILLAMQNWNSFVWPLIVLRDSDKFTLTIGIASLINPYSANYDVMIAGSVVAILPILILFLLNQRFFIAGLTSGGVKG